MKLSAVISIAYLVLFTTACSQGNKIEKGYAYARNILSGVKPSVKLSEDGTVTTTTKEPGIEYFIYARTKDTTIPVVRNIWINGKVYYAYAEEVADLPVIMENNPYYPGKKDTLVESGNGNVWKINVGKLISADTSFHKPREPLNAQVYIGFLSKGKLNYYPISSLKFIEPVRLQ